MSESTSSTHEFFIPDPAIVAALAARPLIDKHRASLEVKRKISPKAIEERIYASVLTVEDLEALGLPPTFKLPGMAFLVHPPGRGAYEPTIVVYRPDEPTDPKRKYEWPAGVRARLDLPPGAREAVFDPLRRLYIGEGWLKGDAARSAALPILTLPGVWTFGWKPEAGLPILLDWEGIPLNGRHLFPIFDCDAWENNQVGLALGCLTVFLQNRGAVVTWIKLPKGPNGEKLGLDDWLALGHDVSELDNLRVDPGLPYLAGLELNDKGNATRFAATAAGRACYSPKLKKWLVWDGKRFDSENQEAARALAVETVDETAAVAAALPASNQNTVKKDLTVHVKRMGSRDAVDDMLVMARSEMTVRLDELDTDPWLLNVANGVVDLRTGELLPHDPVNLMTMVSPVEYDPDARLEDWDRLIDQTTAGKEGLPDFLRQGAGYSATGLTIEEKFFMALGPTRTGKSSILEAIGASLGDYAATAAFSTFLRKVEDGGPREDLARLRGKRFVSAVEVEEEKVLADALIKSLTGGEGITARNLYENTAEFIPALKLWLAANEEPKISQDNEAMWERVLRIPFDNYVPEDKRDKSLKNRLRDSKVGGPAVLAWLVRGAMEWAKNGLVVPSSVKTATAGYRERMDPIAGFLDDECLLNPAARYPASDIFPDYDRWAKRNAIANKLGRNKFFEALRGWGFTDHRGTDGKNRHWLGLQPLGIQVNADGRTGASEFESMVG